MPRQIPPKVHIHGRSPNVTADFRGTVVEALCERYKLPPVVVSQEVYRGGPGTVTRSRCSAGTASGSWGISLGYFRNRYRDRHPFSVDMG